MAAGRAWVLNLDAELELEVPAYTPSAGVREAIRTWAPVLAASLLDEGDVLVDEASAPGIARGLRGFAYSPTPRAIALLRRAGAEPEPHPAVDVLRRVTSRAFSASLGATLPGAAFVGSFDDARAKIAAAPPVGDGWRIKRAFGMSGRGHRVVAAGALAGPDEAFLRASVARGGVQIEPNVPIVEEVAIHGLIARAGAVRIGRLVAQRCDARGAWVATEPAEAPAIEARLRDEATRVSAALHAAGYFGPFGIDAFTWRDRDGGVHLQPRSEVNARYTMGFAVGFGLRARAPSVC